MKPAIDYWKTTLSNLPEALDLPSDYARLGRTTGQRWRQRFSLDAQVSESARCCAHSLHAPLSAVFASAFAALLSRWSGQSDIVVGLPADDHDGADVDVPVSGLAAVLPLRFRIDPGTTLNDLVERTRDFLRDASAAPKVAYADVLQALNIETVHGRSAVFQASFRFHSAAQKVWQWRDRGPDAVRSPAARSAEDLGLWIHEHPRELSGGLSCNADLFSQQTAQRCVDRFKGFLVAALAAPTEAISQIEIIADEECDALRRWNDTAVPLAAADTVCTLLERQAAQTPRDCALRAGDSTLNYAELGARANRLANLLRGRGIRRGTLVGVHVQRSADMVVVQHAVLSAGAAYVPLDPAYPPDRLMHMADDASLALVITESTHAETLPWPPEKTVLLDRDAHEISSQSDTLPRDAMLDALPEDPAYVIYTSGSTGKPKGVVVQHRAVVNFLASMAGKPGLQASDRLVAVTTLSFDIAVLELLLPLTRGAQVVLASREVTSDGRALRALLESSGATVMQATPTTWRMLIDAGWQGGPKFKALIGGEALPLDLARQLLERTGELWNMYGPTETTVWSTCWRVNEPESGISVGQPIANTQVHVLDEQRRLCPIGVPGEIYLGGEGVTLGYLNRPELTAERFVTDPFGAAGAKLYRTGDRGRWRHDGQLEHLGRLDFQVKIRGHRIELGEIESNLADHSRVSRVVVVAREDEPGDQRLVAYLVARGSMPTSSELREHLRAKLPDYMIPQHFVQIDSVPTLPNGKIDRKALPAPSTRAAPSNAGARPPQSTAEAAFAEVWQRLLNVDQVSGTDNFFELGGHSLLAAQAAEEIERRLGIRIPAQRFVHDTLAMLAATPPQTERTHGETPKGAGWFARALGMLRT